MNIRKKPRFLRQEWFRHGNLRKKWLKWRKPRGNKSRLRRHFAGRGLMPNAGWGAPEAARWMHPSGLQEIMVSNAGQLGALDGKKQAIRIAGSVGGMKRMFIQDAAKEKGIRVLNPRKVEVRQKAEEAPEKKGEAKK